jgi:hypothetical protein
MRWAALVQKSPIQLTGVGSWFTTKIKMEELYRLKEATIRFTQVYET